MSQLPVDLLPTMNGKQRTARIEIDYLSKRCALDKWKVWVCALAALSPIVCVGIASLRTSGQMLYSRGPVAASHAIWETNCQTCHSDFTPISGSAFGLTDKSWSNVSDANCRKCHQGPHHHTNAVFNQTHGIHSANCASCHVDHRGRDADLVRVENRHCTVCHNHLREHLDTSRFTDPIHATISDFNVDHPKFRSLQRDPGTLKFNHKLHMTPGLPYGANPRREFKIDDVPDAYRHYYEKYVAPGKEKIVQLDCQSCHELDRPDSGPTVDGLPDAIAAPRGNGEYYRPVVYERHCRACHPLPYRPGLAYSPAGQLPHRLTASQLENHVREKVDASVVNQLPELLRRPVPEVTPGNRPPDLPTDTRNELVAAQVGQSARYLATAVCAQCHATREQGDRCPDLLAKDAANKPTVRDAYPCPEPDSNDKFHGRFPDVKPAGIPAIWLRHARFDHTAHRTVACFECHKGAYSAGEDSSECAIDVLIPDIENCMRCHAPRDESTAKPSGGARHDCVECHLYHARDEPLAGRGSSLRAAVPPLQSIDGFLDTARPAN